MQSAGAYIVRHSFRSLPDVAEVLWGPKATACCQTVSASPRWTRLACAGAHLAAAHTRKA